MASKLYNTVRAAIAVAHRHDGPYWRRWRSTRVQVNDFTFFVKTKHPPTIRKLSGRSSNKKYLHDWNIFVACRTLQLRAYTVGYVFDGKRFVPCSRAIRRNTTVGYRIRLAERRNLNQTACLPTSRRAVTEIRLLVNNTSGSPVDPSCFTHSVYILSDTAFTAKRPIAVEFGTHFEQIRRRPEPLRCKCIRFEFATFGFRPAR